MIRTYVEKEVMQMKTEIILVKRPKIKTQKPREKSLLPDILSVANFKIKNKKQALKTKMKKKKHFFQILCL